MNGSNAAGRCLTAALLALFAALPARAQSPEHEVEVVEAKFNAGSYKEALKRAGDALASLNFSDDQRKALNKYAGLSAFYLGEPAVAEEHLLRVLYLDPDLELDRYEVAPAAIKFFEELRVRQADDLSRIRRERAEQDRQRKLAAQEEERRKLEQATSRAAVRVVERRSTVTSFLPFGLAQLAQDRPGPAIAFGSAQALLAATSLFAYLNLGALAQDCTYSQDDRVGVPGGNFTVTTRCIPEASAGTAAAYRTVKNVAGWGFYAAWAASVVDALLHHKRPDVTVQPPGAIRLAF